MAERLNVLGVGVSAINMATALATIEGWIASRKRHYVCVTGVHGVMESRRDPELRHIHNSAGMVTPDGMPLVWLLWASGHRSVDRVYGPDLMLAVLERSVERGCRHFLYGASEATLARLQANLHARFPGLDIVGTYSPPFRPLTVNEDAAVVEMINAARPDVVWVGLSTPKQERWMAAHRDCLEAPVLVGVGAAFDFHAGVVRQAPRFIQRSGFEWLFRLTMEPRRLWRRYLRNNPAFLVCLAGQKLGFRRYSLEFGDQARGRVWQVVEPAGSSGVTDHRDPMPIGLRSEAASKRKEHSILGDDELVVVTGAGGFIGAHLVADLLRRGHQRVRAVDIKPLYEWFQLFPGIDNRRCDLRGRDACYAVTDGAAWVYNLAADMGGMGFIETHKAACMQSVLINTHLLLAARDCGVRRFFYASSACVYAADKQTSPDILPLKEGDAYPAMPEDGYGWEKLFSERMCRHFREDCRLATRLARYHNVYGPHGTFAGGREKAPAAICRKVIQAKLSGEPEIEIWGDGEQTRSFMFIDDCVEGTQRIMHSHVEEPLNLGSDRPVTINQLVDIVEAVAGVMLRRRYLADAPKGVRGRNSDNTLIRQRLGWAPSISLEEGLEKTYRWIYDQMTGIEADQSAVVSL